MSKKYFHIDSMNQFYLLNYMYLLIFSLRREQGRVCAAGGAPPHDLRDTAADRCLPVWLLRYRSAADRRRLLTRGVGAAYLWTAGCMCLSTVFWLLVAY